jgi:hypothetical protein
MKSGKRNEVWLGTLALMVLTYGTAIGGFPDGGNHDVLDAGSSYRLFAKCDSEFQLLRNRAIIQHHTVKLPASALSTGHVRG